MAEHTPGPWEVCNGTDVFTVSGATNRHGLTAADNDGWQIAGCEGGLTHTGHGYVSVEIEEAEANANLIAAAPKLLAAVPSTTLLIEETTTPPLRMIVWPV